MKKAPCKKYRKFKDENQQLGKGKIFQFCEFGPSFDKKKGCQM